MDCDCSLVTVVLRQGIVDEHRGSEFRLPANHVHYVRPTTPTQVSEVIYDAGDGL
jgi:hypothetical protein